MTPWELDLIINGLFIYERPDGSTYTSADYKLRDYGVKCVGRTGPAKATPTRSAKTTKIGLVRRMVARCRKAFAHTLPPYPSTD